MNLLKHNQSFTGKYRCEEEPEGLTQILSMSPDSALDDSAEKEATEAAFTTQKMPRSNLPGSGIYGSA